MKYLLGDQWEDTFPDYYCGPEDYRIRIRAFANLERLTGIYFVRPRSARLLWNYVREVGFVEVWRKVVSRLQEKYRNEKFVSLGIGEVEQAPPDGIHEIGGRVAFLAPGFPACIERIVLPDAFIAGLPEGFPGLEDGDAIRYLAGCYELRPQVDWWQQIRTWNAYSGYQFSPPVADGIARTICELTAKVDWTSARALATEPPTETCESTPFTPSSGRTAESPRRKRGVLFGYGHYAKTNILPNIRRHIEVDVIHEVDPTQIPPTSHGERPAWDTAPIPRDDEDCEVCLIAGYHHKSGSEEFFFFDVLAEK